MLFWVTLHLLGGTVLRVIHRINYKCLVFDSDEVVSASASADQFGVVGFWSSFYFGL